MTDCTEWHLLLQADLDGELTPAEAARVTAHAESCAACAALRDRLSAMSARVAREAPRFTAPPILLAAVQAAAVAGAPPAAASNVVALPPRPRRWARETLGFLAGAAIAASVTLTVMPTGGGGADSGNPAEQIVADHIRALQPGHLTDVASNDHHNVKPWFDGKLDFAPPVPQFAQYPLLGGRLDYAAGHTMAALAYRVGQHEVDVYVRPADPRSKPYAGNRDGYHYICWLQGGMVLWAVSDLDRNELAAFVQDWKDAT